MEVNLEILPRSQYAEHTFADGDRIEIVHAVGGG
jgi:sulfur carrier protein